MLDVEKDKLYKIQDKIKKTENNLNKTKKKREKIQSRIGEIFSNQKRDKESLKRTKNDMKKISKRIDITEEGIENLKKQMGLKKNGLSIVIRELWFSYEDTFFNSTKNEDCLRVLIDELCLSIEEREIKEKKEIAKNEALGLVLTKTKDDKKRIVSNIKGKDKEIALQNKVLQATKNDEKELQKMITKLKQDQKRLEGLIAKLEAERKKSKEPKAPVGSLIWPTKSRNIAREFGRYKHPESGTILINKGIDIEAPLGSPVFAVANGDVVYADFFMGYGNLIMIDHNGSLYSLYANLKEVNVGIEDRVKKGQTIGSVGKSKEGETILHFEIRLDGKAQDPMDWIR